MTAMAGFLLSLAALIHLTYHGLSVLIVAPLMALVAVLFSEVRRRCLPRTPRCSCPRWRDSWRSTSPCHAQGEGYDIAEVEAGSPDRSPGLTLAVGPIVLVVALNYVFSALVLPQLDAAYLALPFYGETLLDKVRGVWAIIAALVISISTLRALNWRRISRPRRALGDGASASVLPVLNTASQVGFGAVIASLPAFALVRNAVRGVAPGNPLISLAIALNVLAGITGSASGGMSIALQTLGARYLELGQAAEISPELCTG